ncbi:Aste57867_18483 [Aphanomyces stellatus]|uniref:Aste57867_18483 protein n=1 Tax=Aphanomyces stellatus TaxID=120398 RepID=A0A485LAT2_9STRA|nr:hypothetical protein As57867_018421 [Aphanomyces stellatus]VFT95219.1 Aste57867_18483 [Aphanomyces stellatus]
MAPTTTVQDGLVAALEERVEELTREVLERDELIVHLQAEKRELRRWAEQLHHRTMAKVSPFDEVAAADKSATTADLERQVNEAQGKMKALTQQCAAQKEEIAKLYRQVYEKDEEAEDLVLQMQSLRDQLAEVQCRVAETPATSPPKHMAVEWIEETARYPTPHFQMDSKEVHYIVSQWTQNPAKLKSLMAWLIEMSDEDVNMPVAAQLGSIPPTPPPPSQLPLAIELPRLTHEVRDGFLTMVVPLLRSQMSRTIHVHTRPYDQAHTDLRIRVTPKPATT